MSRNVTARQREFKQACKKWLRWIGRGLLALFLFLGGWFVVVRVTSPIHAIHTETVLSSEKERPAPAVWGLRVGTYNIAHGRGGKLNTPNRNGESEETRLERLRDMGHLLRQLNLDLLALNEVDFDCSRSHREQQGQRIADFARFPYRVYQRNVDMSLPGYSLRFGNALLSRYPIKNPRIIRFPALKFWENLGGGNHDALLCTVETPEGRDIDVLVVHLEVRSEDSRARCAERIIQLQRECSNPLIVLGDFNATPTGFPDTRKSSLNVNSMDLLARYGNFVRHPQAENAARYFSFPSEKPVRVIDWILASPPLRFAAYRVIHTPLSDHLPVTAELTYRDRL